MQIFKCCHMKLNKMSTLDNFCQSLISQPLRGVTVILAVLPIDHGFSSHKLLHYDRFSTSHTLGVALPQTLLMQDALCHNTRFKKQGIKFRFLQQYSLNGCHKQHYYARLRFVSMQQQQNMITSIEIQHSTELSVAYIYNYFSIQIHLQRSSF